MLILGIIVIEDLFLALYLAALAPVLGQADMALAAGEVRSLVVPLGGEAPVSVEVTGGATPLRAFAPPCGCGR